MPPNDVVVASCDVNEAAAAEVAWSRGGPGSRAPGVFESRRCYFVGEDENKIDTSENETSKAGD